jgi:hypothetical protein
MSGRMRFWNRGVIAIFSATMSVVTLSCSTAPEAARPSGEWQLGTTPSVGTELVPPANEKIIGYFSSPSGDVAAAVRSNGVCDLMVYSPAARSAPFIAVGTGRPHSASEGTGWSSKFAKAFKATPPEQAFTYASMPIDRDGTIQIACGERLLYGIVEFPAAENGSGPSASPGAVTGTGSISVEQLSCAGRCYILVAGPDEMREKVIG